MGANVAGVGVSSSGACRRCHHHNSVAARVAPIGAVVCGKFAFYFLTLKIIELRTTTLEPLSDGRYSHRSFGMFMTVLDKESCEQTTTPKDTTAR